MNNALFGPYRRLFQGEVGVSDALASVSAAGSSGGGAGSVGNGSNGGAANAGGGNGSAGGQSTVPVTDFRTFIDEKGNITKADGFFDKDTAHLGKRFTSVGSLAKSYVNLERQLSNSNKVALPGENSTQEEWDAFYARLGRPAKADEYKIERPESLKDLPTDDAAIAEFRQLAHKEGLSAKQVDALTKWHFGSTEKQLAQLAESQAASQEAAAASLKQEWGVNYGKQMELAKNAARVLGGEDLIANKVLANDPVFIKALAKAGAMMNEATLAGGRQQMAAPANPRDEINKVLGDKADPYWKSNHPQHAARVAYVQGLFAQANPEPARE